MATVIFDFDSTLVSCESLEVILQAQVKQRPDLVKQLHDLTEQGMNGACSFQDSLSNRLKIAQPEKKGVIAFADKIESFVTEGMEPLVRNLMKASVQVWIISGALYEVLLPIGKKLGIPESHIRGVRLLWSPHGQFVKIDENDPFSHSKCEGAKVLASHWTSPRIAIGDGITDFALFENHLVDHFIAFTQHVKRQTLLTKGVIEAENVPILSQILEKLLHDKTLFSERQN